MPRRTSRRSHAATRATARVADLAAALEAIAPRRLAADWDNVGLLAGRAEWPAGRVLLTIDLTDDVAREALRTGTNAIVAYHPPIFKGIRCVTPDAECPTRMLPDLLASRVSIFSLHTALDAAPGGTNDALLDAFDVSERFPLSPTISETREYKLAVFVPDAGTHAGCPARLRAALSAAGAGVIGQYSECSFEARGRGTFRGGESSNPTIGAAGRFESVDEVRLEMIVPRARIGEVVRAVYAHHPYEEPAFDLNPLHTPEARGAAGLGRVGRLRRPQRGAALLRSLGKIADLTRADAVGDVRRRFKSVTAAAGSFGVRQFRDADSLVITGEFKHHDALDLLRRGIAAVCLGHDASERPVLPVVQRRLRLALPGLRVSIARADRSPLRRVTI